jgi:hypothetical protein
VERPIVFSQPEQKAFSKSLVFLKSQQQEFFLAHALQHMIIADGDKTSKKKKRR